jgi:predicted ArsR family transcriptional regulator
MKPIRWNRRFWESTRGRIVTLLRRGSHTVNELAAALELTDNAVRAHLTAMERDGLIHHSGIRAGTRKPNMIFDLTREAEQLFYRAYGPVLGELLTVLGKRLSAQKVGNVLREVGHRMAARYGPAQPGATVPERLQQAATLLGELGGLAEVEQQDGGLALRGFGCPLAAVVAGHPELCRAMETLLTDIVGAPVRERCQREPTPQCYFQVRVGEA